MSTLETDRLILRQPAERDRTRFVELFTDESFTVFGGVHDAESANRRFDEMLWLSSLIPFAKQPVIEKSSGTIVGYTGVGRVTFEGLDRLEWGWRLVTEARGNGYATEAAGALLGLADEVTSGELLCIIAVSNRPSRRVAQKLGFAWWREHLWDDDPEPTDLLLRQVGGGGPPLIVPAG